VPYYPRLAVAPSGEVLAAWNSWNAKHPNGARGMLVAWHAPGRRFGAPQGLPTAPMGALPQFDARGTAYLNGFCNALVLRAPAHTHHFGRPVVLTSSPVLSFSLSLSGAGKGLAAWVRGGCSFDAAAGDTPGPVFFSVLHAGTFTKPTALTSAAIEAAYSNAVATPGGGTLTWASNYLPPASPGAFGLPGAFSHQVGADGHAGPAQPITNGLVALTADGGGDVVFAPPADYFQQLSSFGPPNPVFVRRAGGGADQPAAVNSGQVAVAAPAGRAVALVWNTSANGIIGGSLAFSVWRP